ncbi:winged helix-turn-helix transcriptional regulator [Actinoplanes sp. NBRC 103695]|uniref:winged helix-turn-helix transcriptional regulator n=1 Tax=Actinoplanes sp. NBRC 103695 TaxID=3032202 RepID=UPI00255278F2|nr:winged helix-turn-helix transcriptional regulator [Actinoplanes sp. NBRC 103695]
MVQRTVLPTSPVGVEYSLTPLGRSLRDPFLHLHGWTVDHSDEITKYQQEYDERWPRNASATGRAESVPERRAAPFRAFPGPRGCLMMGC